MPALRPWSLLFALFATLFTSKVLAEEDFLAGTRFQPVEIRHRITAVFARGSATLEVERTFYNPGERPDQVLLYLGTPEGGVATRLRTLGEEGGRPRWFEGELMEAEAAAAKYQELTGLGGFTPKDPALLSWRSPRQLLLQVFPCFAKQNKVVSYTFVVPAPYRNGAYEFELPRLGLEERPAVFVFRPENATDALFLGDRRLAPGTEVKAELGDDQDPKIVRLMPYRPPPIDGELAVADSGLGRSYVHARFAVARQLSEVPAHVSLVLGLDNSRSLSHARGSLLTLAKGALQRFRGAEVQIIDFARTPKPRFTSFVDKAVALAALERELSGSFTLESENGTELARALSEAQRWMGRVPRGRERRIIFLTDGLVRAGLSPQAVIASAAGDGSILHIVEHSTVSGLHRDDHHTWAQAARQTGGLMWTGSPSGEDCPECLELVRPLRLDHASFQLSDLPQPVSEGSLEEGAGIEVTRLSPEVVDWASLSGELWSKPYRQTITPNEKASRLWSALVFGSYEHAQFREAEMMVLARRGGAVSPVTSYLAIEPGVRPSTEGLDWHGSGTGSGQGFGSGHGRLGGAHRTRAPNLTPFDPLAYLTELLSQHLVQCGGQKGTLKVKLETHLTEIAEARLTTFPDDSELFQCMTDAAWSLDLRGKRFPERQRFWEIAL